MPVHHCSACFSNWGTFINWLAQNIGRKWNHWQKIVIVILEKGLLNDKKSCKTQKKNRLWEPDGAWDVKSGHERERVDKFIVRSNITSNKLQDFETVSRGSGHMCTLFVWYFQASVSRKGQLTFLPQNCFFRICLFAFSNLFHFDNLRLPEESPFQRRFSPWR